MRAALHRYLEGAAKRLERLCGFPTVVGGVFAALVYCMTPNSMADPDIWWHLRDAETLLHLHGFLRVDSYSFTAKGAPWINHEWLAEVPFYVGWRAMGEQGVLLVTLVAIEAVMLGVFYLAYRRSRSLGAAALVSTAAAGLATVSFGPRTLLFGWVCLVAELIVLERFRSGDAGGRAVWALPALFALWVNTHGSWLIGMVVLGVFLACGSVRVCAGEIENAAWTPKQMRRLIGAAGLSIAALFLNPYGWRLVAYPFDLAFRQRLNIAHVEEWQALDVHSMRGRLFLLSLAALFVLQLIRRRRWALYEIGFLGISVYAAMSYSRFLFLAAILMMPLMAPSFARERRSRARRNQPVMNAVLLLALAALVALHFPASLTAAQRADLVKTKYPVKALAYLRGLPRDGHWFNEYAWGGFLEFYVRQAPVMIDSRVDIFEYNGTFKDYLDAIGLRGTDTILRKYQIRYVLLARDAPMIAYLLQRPGWRLDYEDGTAILLERAEGHP